MTCYAQGMKSVLSLSKATILIINPAATVAHRSVVQWLAIQTSMPSHIDVLENVNTAALHAALIAHAGDRDPVIVTQRPLLKAAFKKYDLVLVLCVSNEQVRTGQAPFRLIGMCVRHRHLILIGPQLVEAWPLPGSRTRWQTACELLALGITGAVSVLTVLLVVAVITVQEAVLRRRVQP